MIFYSVHFNRPDFIKIQKKCIDKIGGKLVIIDNGTDPKIEEECKKLNINYHKYEGEKTTDPSRSHGLALNFARKLIDYSDDWCLIDHDLFPLKEIDFGDFDIISIPQIRQAVTYLWPGFTAAKKKIRIDNIDFLPNHKGDTGCNTDELLLNGNKLKAIKETYMGDPVTGYYQNSLVIVEIGDLAIHYMNGSEWMPTDKNISTDKNKKLLDILNL